MDEASRVPLITGEDLATFGRCRFVHRVFRPRDAWKTREPPDDPRKLLKEWAAQGDKFVEDHPEQFELLPGGWDHEHCDVCQARIEDGNGYWPNEDESVGQVDLCESCYGRVRELLRA